MPNCDNGIDKIALLVPFQENLHPYSFDLQCFGSLIFSNMIHDKETIVVCLTNEEVA